MPVGHEVRFPRHSAVEDLEELVDVLVTEACAHDLAAEKRRIAHDHIRVRPLGLFRMGRVRQVQQGVLLTDVVERLEDRVARVAESMREHPLDLADPDRDSRQLGRERVDLDT
jgi:hypothetical protein